MVLSFCLPVALVPLVLFTRRPRPDGRPGQSPRHDRSCAACIVSLIVGLNAFLIVQYLSRAVALDRRPASTDDVQRCIWASRVIDCDIHNAVPSVEALFPYLSEHWREYIRTSAFKGPVDTAYPPRAPTTVAPGVSVPRRAARVEPRADPAGRARSVGRRSRHPELRLRGRQPAQPGHRRGHGLGGQRLADRRVARQGAAPARLDGRADARCPRWPPGRSSASATTPASSRCCCRSAREAPYGNRRYLPIFEAAARHDLVVSLQFGGAPGNPPTGSGWPSYYIEEYAGMAQVFQTQVLNMVVEGVFDRFADLRVALIEGGWTWLPSLMWRIDKDWKGLRRRCPGTRARRRRTSASTSG